MANPGKVGYKSPPAQHRFKPGHSGNPAGRPKGSVNLATIVRRCFNETMEVTVRGKKKTISMREALVRKISQLGLGGDLKALQFALQLGAYADGTEPSADTDEASKAERQKLLGEIVASFAPKKAADGSD